MDENIREKGIAQCIAERQGTTPRGAFSKSAFVRTGGAALRDINELAGSYVMGDGMAFANPDNASRADTPDDMRGDKGHKIANNMGIDEFYIPPAETTSAGFNPNLMPFHSTAFDAMSENAAAEDAAKVKTVGGYSDFREIPLRKLEELLNANPEIQKQVWDYRDSLLDKVRNGKANMEDHDIIEAMFGHAFDLLPADKTE